MVSALAFPKLIKSYLPSVPDEIRLLFAATLPAISVIGYFLALNAIEHARHVAEDPDGGFMGPLVLLFVGFPIFGPMIAIACFVAVRVYKDS